MGGVCYCVRLFQQALQSSSSPSPLSPHLTTDKEEAEQARIPNHKKPTVGLSLSSNLQRAGSIKDLISKISGSNYFSSASPYSGPGRFLKSYSMEALNTSKPKSNPFMPSRARPDGSPVPKICGNPLKGNTQNEAELSQRDRCLEGGSTQKTDSKPRSAALTTDSGRDSVADSGMGSVRISKSKGRENKKQCLTEHSALA